MLQCGAPAGGGGGVGSLTGGGEGLFRGGRRSDCWSIFSMRLGVRLLPHESLGVRLLPYESLGVRLLPHESLGVRL